MGGTQDFPIEESSGGDKCGLSEPRWRTQELELSEAAAAEKTEMKCFGKQKNGSVYIT